VDPRFAAALKGKAQIYAWNNDAERAIRGFETYVNKKPTDMDARYQLGELYFTSNREDAAHGEYKKTLKLIREVREARNKAREAKPQEGRPTP
jgi:DNA-binding SARP family transcriptional activator